MSQSSSQFDLSSVNSAQQCETIARILQPHNIRVAHKPITTLRRLLTNAKDKDDPEDKQGAVYKIKCCHCQASYIGETGRNLSTRLTEHKRATRNGDINNPLMTTVQVVETSVTVMVNNNSPIQDYVHQTIKLNLLLDRAMLSNNWV